jgi:hypothetical protein
MPKSLALVELVNHSEFCKYIHLVEFIHSYINQFCMAFSTLFTCVLRSSRACFRSRNCSISSFKKVLLKLDNLDLYRL